MSFYDLEVKSQVRMGELQRQMARAALDKEIERQGKPAGAGRSRPSSERPGRWHLPLILRRGHA